eukprot:TRINITY_DN282_c0_g1_i1.p1 TRINITY_DN282_c0_g1~~TRINITY_DN282_c0_g1_i1.p1  ORF type:complete len:206 (-),score=51.33 TRINITY_DN282_c0_g1_i1:488-1105(-)
MPGGITIETITVTRPMKVIAFVCTFITTFLMIGACSTSDWVVSEGWHEGLFVQCADKGALTPLPFDAENILGCQKAHNVGYLRGVAALVIIVVFTDFFGTLLTGLGLRSTDPNKKYKYYRVAIYSLILSVLALFLALIIYPVSFTKDISTGDDRRWHFGFAYGASWASAILISLSLVLLICDRESEEIFYKERVGDEDEDPEEEV